MLTCVPSHTTTVTCLSHRRVQKAFHPYAIYDVASYASNPKWSNASLQINANRSWPALNPTTAIVGANVTRDVVVYNDVVNAASTDITFKWSASYTRGAEISGGAFAVASGALDLGKVQAGYHSSFAFSFVVPKAKGGGDGDGGGNGIGSNKMLWLVMQSVDTSSGTVLFTEDRVYINVSTA